MFAVLEQDGGFSGVTYTDISDEIELHHTRQGETILEVDVAPENIIPPLPDSIAIQEFDYGVPTIAQLRVGMNWKQHAYLKSTDWYVMRKVETGKEVPVEISIKRAEARTALNR